VGSSPLGGGELPPLGASALTVREARPSPEPGPARDALAAVNDARARRAEELLTGPLQAYLDRAIGVVRARLKGPKARRGTKWWDGAGPAETKALDPGYVLPDKITDELREQLPTAALTIATESATETGHRLAAGDDGDLAALDEDEIASAVEDAVKRILGVADRHARELRAAILEADRDAESLDDVFDRIEEAHRKGGNWVLMSGRTLANALANDAAYRQALRLGVTHAQWLSRRDERVRRTHAHTGGADGQVRRLGDHFRVGKFRLRFPGDPTDLPASWGEIANCRCGLLFRKPDRDIRKRLGRVFGAEGDPEAPADALDTLARALRKAQGTPDGPEIIATPPELDLPPVAALVRLGRDIVGYRQLAEPVEAAPGQVVTAPSALVLALAPVAATATTLAVLIPAGAIVGVAGGAVIIPQGAPLEVLGAGAEGLRTVLISEPAP
jgi:hypothetical protein